MSTLAGIVISPDVTASETSVNWQANQVDTATKVAMVKGATIETRGDGLVIRLRMEGDTTQEIMLSVEQARSLSLAIITAVNRQERHTHARRTTGTPQLQPVTR